MTSILKGSSDHLKVKHLPVEGTDEHTDLFSSSNYTYFPKWGCSFDKLSQFTAGDAALKSKCFNLEKCRIFLRKNVNAQDCDLKGRNFQLFFTPNKPSLKKSLRGNLTSPSPDDDISLENSRLEKNLYTNKRCYIPFLLLSPPSDNYSNEQMGLYESLYKTQNSNEKVFSISRVRRKEPLISPDPYTGKQMHKNSVGHLFTLSLLKSPSPDTPDTQFENMLTHFEQFCRRKDLNVERIDNTASTECTFKPKINSNCAKLLQGSQKLSGWGPDINVFTRLYNKKDENIVKLCQIAEKKHLTNKILINRAISTKFIKNVDKKDSTKLISQFIVELWCKYFKHIFLRNTKTKKLPFNFNYQSLKRVNEIKNYKCYNVMEFTRKKKLCQTKKYLNAHKELNRVFIFRHILLGLRNVMKGKYEAKIFIWKDIYSSTKISTNTGKHIFFLQYSGQNTVNFVRNAFCQKNEINCIYFIKITINSIEEKMRLYCNKEKKISLSENLWNRSSKHGKKVVCDSKIKVNNRCTEQFKKINDELNPPHNFEIKENTSSVLKCSSFYPFASKRRAQCLLTMVNVTADCSNVSLSSPLNKNSLFPKQNSSLPKNKLIKNMNIHSEKILQETIPNLKPISASGLNTSLEKQYTLMRIKTVPRGGKYVNKCLKKTDISSKTKTKSLSYNGRENIDFKACTFEPKINEVPYFIKTMRDDYERARQFY